MIFEEFYNWSMLNEYEDSLTIDRIDNNGNYEPSNCRWVDMETQARNTRRNKCFTIYGITKSLVEWCEEYSINYNTVQDRLLRGWSIKDSLTKSLMVNQFDKGEI